jgi:hypothetical protein
MSDRSSPATTPPLDDSPVAVFLRALQAEDEAEDSAGRSATFAEMDERCQRWKAAATLAALEERRRQRKSAAGTVASRGPDEAGRTLSPAAAPAEAGPLLRSLAEELDQDPRKLREALRSLCDTGLPALIRRVVQDGKVRGL